MNWTMFLTGAALAGTLPMVALAAGAQSEFNATCLVLASAAPEAGESLEQAAHRQGMAIYFAGRVRAEHGRLIDAFDKSLKPSSPQEAAAYSLACSREFSEALMDLGANEERLQEVAAKIGLATKPK